MKQLSKQEVAQLFSQNNENLKQYKKKGTFLFRIADVGESILTIVNGKLETIKTAGNYDVVLRNIVLGSSAEEYIISTESFYKRYTILEGSYTISGKEWQMAKASGEVLAFEYLGPDQIEFEPSWGGYMICNPGDMICNPLGGSPSDIYRIERSTFEDTYSLKNQ